jgi:hypothetical protein
MEAAGPLEQYVFAFGYPRIRNTAIYGADCGAFFVIEEAYALGAFFRCDIIYVFGDRRMLGATIES